MSSPSIYRTTARHSYLPESETLVGVAFSAVQGKKFRPTRMKETWKTNEKDGAINHFFYEVELSGPVQGNSGDLKPIGRRWYSETDEASGFPQEFVPLLFVEETQ